jgi:hypothetical protein
MSSKKGAWQMTNLGIHQLAPCDGPASGGSWKNNMDRVAQCDLAAIQKDGKAGRLKPWKPRPTIYCRAGFERRYKNL